MDIRVIPSCLGVNQLDCQFAAAAVYFEPEVSAFMIGLDFSQFYIAGVFQGESVRSLGTDFVRLTPSPPLCFLSTCVWCSTSSVPELICSIGCCLGHLRALSIYRLSDAGNREPFLGLFHLL